MLRTDTPKTIYLKDFIFRSKRINPEYIVKTSKGEFRGSIVSLHKKLFGLFPEIVPLALSVTESFA